MILENDAAYCSMVPRGSLIFSSGTKNSGSNFEASHHGLPRTRTGPVKVRLDAPTFLPKIAGYSTSTSSGSKPVNFQSAEALAPKDREPQ